MTTIFIINSTKSQQFINEVFESVVAADEDVHLLQLPSVQHLDPPIEEIITEIDRDVRYAVDTLPEEDTAANLTEFAIEVDADRICIGILDRTSAGKVHVDELMQSLLLHQQLSGHLIFGEQIMTLEGLEYEIHPSNA